MKRASVEGEVLVRGGGRVPVQGQVEGHTALAVSRSITFATRSCVLPTPWTNRTGAPPGRGVDVADRAGGRLHPAAVLVETLPFRLVMVSPSHVATALQ